jgi:hypothetical protein
MLLDNFPYGIGPVSFSARCKDGTRFAIARSYLGRTALIFTPTRMFHVRLVSLYGNPKEIEARLSKRVLVLNVLDLGGQRFEVSFEFESSASARIAYHTLLAICQGRAFRLVDMTELNPGIYHFKAEHERIQKLLAKASVVQPLLLDLQTLYHLLSNAGLETHEGVVMSPALFDPQVHLSADQRATYLIAEAWSNTHAFLADLHGMKRWLELQPEEAWGGVYRFTQALFPDVGDFAELVRALGEAEKQMVAHVDAVSALISEKAKEESDPIPYFSRAFWAHVAMGRSHRDARE